MSDTWGPLKRMAHNTAAAQGLGSLLGDEPAAPGDDSLRYSAVQPDDLMMLGGAGLGKATMLMDGAIEAKWARDKAAMLARIATQSAAQDADKAALSRVVPVPQSRVLHADYLRNADKLSKLNLYDTSGGGLFSEPEIERRFIRRAHDASPEGIDPNAWAAVKDHEDLVKSTRGDLNKSFDKWGKQSRKEQTSGWSLLDHARYRLRGLKLPGSDE